MRKIEINQNSLNITEAMKQLTTIEIPVANKLELFIFPIKSNEFDYSASAEKLLESVADFALSRKTKEYIGKQNSMKLSKAARDKFIEWKSNEGELGEFLLFCFLEGHLRAPKILSKLELKTANEKYVNGADGLHYLQLPNGDFQLIFGESKLYKSLTNGIREAFKSIKNFKGSPSQQNDKKSGITFERSLLSSMLDRDILTDDEKSFLNNIIYPSQGEKSINVDDAFGIFVGYEIDYEDERKTLTNKQFREQVEEKIKKEIESKKDNIERYIENLDLYGHVFYIYILPFSKINESKKKMLKELIG